MKKTVVALIVLSSVFGMANAAGYLEADGVYGRMSSGCVLPDSCERKNGGFGLRFGSKVERGGVFDFGFFSLDAVELGLVKYGRVQSNGSQSQLIYTGGTSAPSSTRTYVTYATTNTISANALTGALVGRGSVVDDLVVVARVGLAYMSTRSAYTSGGAKNGAIVENRLQPVLGVGLEYSVMDPVKLVAGVDWTRYRAGQSDGGAQKGQIMSVSVGLQLSFN